MTILASDPKDSLAALQRLASAPTNEVYTAPQRAAEIGAIWHAERERMLPVLNSTTINIDANLKRVAVLQEGVRAFAVRMIALRLFATSFRDVPLQGTDQIAVPYFPLQTQASTDWDETQGYQFGGTVNQQSKLITVNKRKYQSIDYTSQTFRRQPFFDSVQLTRMNAEKLAVDVATDVMSVITAANFGAAVKTVAAASITSDDVVDVRGAVNAANWPDTGRGLIVDSTVDTTLQKDSAYKLTLNIGTSEVIQQGKLPNLSGFNYAWMPNFPSNGENLIGAAVFNSGILAAFCPVEPTPEVRQQLSAYEVATDTMTGISMNYRAWGLAQADRSYGIIECAYGYQAGEANAIKRIVHP